MAAITIDEVPPSKVHINLGDNSERANGLELCCPAEVGNSPVLYCTPTGQASSDQRLARWVNISQLLISRSRLTVVNV